MTQKQFIKLISIKVYNYIKKNGLDEQAADALWNDIADAIGELREEK